MCTDCTDIYICKVVGNLHRNVYGCVISNMCTCIENPPSTNSATTPLSEQGACVSSFISCWLSAGVPFLNIKIFSVAHFEGFEVHGNELSERLRRVEGDQKQSGSNRPCLHSARPQTHRLSCSEATSSPWARWTPAFQAQAKQISLLNQSIGKWMPKFQRVTPFFPHFEDLFLGVSWEPQRLSFVPSAQIQ